jgi:hypothetical protein
MYEIWKWRMEMADGDGVWRWRMEMADGDGGWRWWMEMADGDGGWGWRMEIPTAETQISKEYSLSNINGKCKICKI